MAKETPDKDFLEYVVKSIVDKKDAVEIDRKIDEMGVLLTVKVDPADMGKLIGKQGQTMKAIKHLMKLIGLKNKARVNVKLLEPEKK